MDEVYMNLALELALKGEGKVNPNPMVGAVIVKNEKVIAKGFHRAYGEDHAEVDAFRNAKENMEDATLYVTLEPCCHHGKTPPCVDEIIKRKIKKVIVGCLDPNPLVRGKGIKKMLEHGIEVEMSTLEEKCKGINEIFFKYVTCKRPFVIMKSAMTLDGKIASKSGDSKWITCEEARNEVHKLRNKVSGIMVGIGTVISDNPQLTCRIPEGRNPIRIVVDTFLKIPLESKVLENCEKISTIIATTDKASSEKIKMIQEKNAQVLILPEKMGKVDLTKLMDRLGDLGVDSVLLEGGGTLNYSAMKEKIVDKVKVYISPKMVGGQGKTPLEGEGVLKIQDAIKINKLSMKTIGTDIVLEGYVEKGE